MKSRFPNTKIEYQVGASRPDIVVEVDSEIAIEVKGPTTSRDLQTIADKIIRYRRYFDKIIVVLFDVKVSPKRYEEWLEGIMDNFNDVVIIEKNF